MNPEFVRMCRANLSVARMLVALGVAALLVFLGTSEVFGMEHWWFPLWFFLASVMWGCWMVSDAFGSEMRSGTWHWQQMVPLFAGRLAFGKFAGALAGPWLFAVLLLPFFPGGEEAGNAVIAAFFGAALALFFAVSLLHRQPYSVLGWLAAVLLALLFFVSLGAPPDEHSGGNWYGVPIDQLFWQATYVVMAGWALVGAWRVTGREKREKMHGWALPTFLVCWAGFWLGFEIEPEADFGSFSELGTNRVERAWFMMMPLLFFSVLAVRNRAGELRGFADALAGRRWADAYGDVPPWLLVLCATAVLFPFAAAQIGFYDTLSLAAVFMLVLRDMALVLLLCITARFRMPEISAVFLLVVLHFLFPLLGGVFESNIFIGSLNPMISIGDMEYSGGERALVMAACALQAAVALFFLARSAVPQIRA